MRLKTVAGALVLGLMLATPAWSAAFTVKMVNKDAAGRAMQFEPAFLKVAPGDTVTFVAVDKGHNTETFAEAIPEGAEGWKGKINQDVTVTFTVEGSYPYKCLPHVALGMVGLIQVGETVGDTEAIEAMRLPSRARARMEELLAEQAAAPAAP